MIISYHICQNLSSNILITYGCDGNDLASNIAGRSKDPVDSTAACGLSAEIFTRYDLRYKMVPQFVNAKLVNTTPISLGVMVDLVGGLEHFLFFHIFGIIIPIDFHIFQMGRSTTNQIHCVSVANKTGVSPIGILFLFANKAGCRTLQNQGLDFRERSCKL